MVPGISLQEIEVCELHRPGAGRDWTILPGFFASGGRESNPPGVPSPPLDSVSPLKDAAKHLLEGRVV